MTVRLRGSPGDLKELLAKLGEKFPPVAVRGMREVGLRLSGDLIQKQIKATNPIPVDMGQYKAAWAMTDTDNGCTVGNSSKQAVVVEIGRKPGTMPPLEPLLYWAKRHGFKNWGGVAVAIQYKIFHKGIKGRRVLGNAIERFRNTMGRTFAKSIREEAAKLQ